MALAGIDYQCHGRKLVQGSTESLTDGIVKRIWLGPKHLGIVSPSASADFVGYEARARFDSGWIIELSKVGVGMPAEKYYSVGC